MSTEERAGRDPSRKEGATDKGPWVAERGLLPSPCPSPCRKLSPSFPFFTAALSTLLKEHQKPILTLRIREKIFTGMLDTGANISIIRAA